MSNVTNKAPSQMEIYGAVGGFTEVSLTHGLSSDVDVAGRKFEIQGDNSSTYTDTVTDFTTIKFSGLVPDNNNEITIRGAWYDEMVDSTLLNANFSLVYSEYVTVTMQLDAPEIVSHRTINPGIRVGGYLEALELTVDNKGNTNSLYQIELKEGSGSWVSYYIGRTGDDIVVLTPPEGTYTARIRGVVRFGDGTAEYTSYDTYGPSMEVELVFNSASTPGAPTFKWKETHDGMQRYDLKVFWEWDQGDGPDLKTFIIRYRVTGSGIAWEDATAVSAGQDAESVLIPSFPTDTEHEFVVEATTWGASAAQSSVSTYTLDPDNTTDRDETIGTNNYIEYRRDAMVGYSNLSGKTETFRIDNTGYVRIGEIGEANITFDPGDGVVQVDGAVIAETIKAASVEMTWLSSSIHPSIYTTGKTYGSSGEGIWMGWTDASTVKFDVGDSGNYIRWTGSAVEIKGKLTLTDGTEIEDSGDLGKGDTTKYIYRADTSQPATPSNGYPPAGWSTEPELLSAGEFNWVCTATFDFQDNQLTSWSTPTQWSGEQGEAGDQGSPGNDGTNGTNGTNGNDGNDGDELRYIYQSAAEEPSSPVSGYPPAGWEVEQMSPGGGETVWRCEAAFSSTGSQLENWSDPPAKHSGSRGAGVFTAGSSGRSSWSNSAADAATTGGNPVTDDIVTLYDSDDTANGYRETRKYSSGGSWTSYLLEVHGDAVITGSLDAGSVGAGTFTGASYELDWLSGVAPSIYTVGKTYGSSTNGFWLGFTDASTVKLDIGDSSQYMRWDGSNLNIRGQLNADDLVAGTVVADELSAGVAMVETLNILDNAVTEQQFSIGGYNYAPIGPVHDDTAGGTLYEDQDTSHTYVYYYIEDHNIPTDAGYSGDGTVRIESELPMLKYTTEIKAVAPGAGNLELWFLTSLHYGDGTTVDWGTLAAPADISDGYIVFVPGDGVFRDVEIEVDLNTVARSFATAIETLVAGDNYYSLAIRLRFRTTGGTKDVYFRNTQFHARLDGFSVYGGKA